MQKKLGFILFFAHLFVSLQSVTTYQKNHTVKELKNYYEQHQT